MAPEPNDMHNKNVENNIETNIGVTIINEEELDENTSSGGEENDEYDGYKLLQQDEDGNFHAATADSDSEDDNEDKFTSSSSMGNENLAAQNLACMSPNCDTSLDIDYKVITRIFTLITILIKIKIIQPALYKNKLCNNKKNYNPFNNFRKF